MSARDELVEFVRRYGGNAGHAVDFPKLIDAYRAEVLRGAAGYVLSRSGDATFDKCSVSTALCTVSEALYRMADE